MSGPTDAVWPTATLDPVARLRVLAAGLPGTVVHERVIDAPFDRVWGFIEDLERSVPAFDETVAGIRVLDRDGTRLRLASTSTWRAGFVPLRFDVDLEPGWCWMVSRPRLYVVGMAAVAEGDRTRWGHLEGLAVRGRVADRLMRPVRWHQGRHVRSDVDGIERIVSRGPLR